MASGSLKRDADTAVIDVTVIDDAAVADVSQLKDEMSGGLGEGGATGLRYTVIDDTHVQTTKKLKLKEDVLEEFFIPFDDPEAIVPDQQQQQQPEEETDEISSWQVCSLCGEKVSDLASHIVDDHTELQDMERSGSSGSTIKKKTTTPVRYKGPFRQVKPVLRFPCDACKTVTKTSEQLKKHMILVHNGHPHTSWMFCGDCEYATRVEDELINHVKIHQMFSILKEDFVQAEQPEKIEDVEYSQTLIECGDCSFTTHYENQMFAHVRMHMGKTDKFGPVTETERKKLAKMEKKDAFVILEGDVMICSFCSFRCENRRIMARHLSKIHGTDVDEEGKNIINVRQSFYYCTLCPFKGKTKADLQEHKMFTIHNKKGGTVTIKHNPLKPKKVL